MPYLNIMGNKIYYNMKGEGDSLILHDGFYNTSTWDKVRDQLAKEFLVIDYDRFGYGKSDRYKEKQYGDIISLYAQELSLVIENLGLDKIHLCGHCLGGAIALYYTIKNQSRVKKIILESTGFFSDQKLVIKSDWTFKPFDQIDRKLRKKLIEMNGEEYARVFWEEISSYKESYIMSENYNMLNDLKSINIPVFLINGDRDFYFDIEHPLRAYRMFKNSRLWIVPMTGHAPHIEKRDFFIKEAINFLKN